MNILWCMLLMPCFSFAMNQQPPAPCVHTAYTASQNHAAYTTSLKNKKLGLMKRIFIALHEPDEPKTDEKLKAIFSLSQELDREMRQTSNTGLMPVMAEGRGKYIKKARKKAAKYSQSSEKPPCDFCYQFSRPQDDDINFIIKRTEFCVWHENRYPYGPGHGLITTLAHRESFQELSPQEAEDLFKLAIVVIREKQECGIPGCEFFFNLDDKSSGNSMRHVHAHVRDRPLGSRYTSLTYLIGNYILKKERELAVNNGFWELIKKRDLKALREIYAPYAELLAYYEPEFPKEECYVCKTLDNKDNDEKNLVFYREGDYIGRLLRFGYTPGHISLYHAVHNKPLDKFNNEDVKSLVATINIAQLKLKQVREPEGINIVVSKGISEDHVHVQIVPSVNGDTSASARVNAGMTIIDMKLEKMAQNLRDSFKVQETPEKLGNKND